MFRRHSRVLEEKRILDYLAGEDAVSETPVSLARKLDVEVHTARRVLDDLVEQGKLRLRTFGDIEPMYYRFRSLDDRWEGTGHRPQGTGPTNGE